MKTTKTLLIIAVAVATGLSACKKEGCTDSLAENYNEKAKKDDGSCTYPDPPQAETPESFTPEFTGEYAALIAIKTVTTTTTGFGDTDTELGTAVAVFSQDGGSSFENAGTVTCEGEELEKQSNSSYVYIPGTTNPLGISFSSPIEWKGTGGTWPAFDTTTTAPFPTVSKITSGDVSTGSSYTLEVGNISDADSVVFAVYGTEDHVLVIESGTTTSHTFSASEISGLGEGTGFIQVTAVKYDPQSIGGKDYYLINETVRSNIVNITE